MGPQGDSDTNLDEDSFAMKTARSIALYTSILNSRKDQIEEFAQFLARLKGINEEEMEVYWRYACDAGLDKEGITIRVSELVSSQQTDNEDMKKIKALQWLCFDLKQRDKALIKTNELLHEFIMKNSLKKCNLLIEKILPKNAISAVCGQFELSGDAFNACREHICLNLYLACQNTYKNWKETLELSKTSNVIGDVASAVKKDKIDKSLFDLVNQFQSQAHNLLMFP